MRAGAVVRLLVAAGVLLAGCGERSAAPDERVAALPTLEGVDSWDTGLRVALIGIDGGTLTVLDPLLADGSVPAFAALADTGAVGSLRSRRPMKSPALWTSIATGLERSEHGIDDFTVAGAEPRHPILVNSTVRRRLTLWDIAGAAGRSVGVAGWWATWPAEPVHGWLLSDRMTRSRWSEWTDGSKTGWLTYPPRLAARVGDLVVDPQEVTAADDPAAMEMLRSLGYVQ